MYTYENVNMYSYMYTHIGIHTCTNIYKDLNMCICINIHTFIDAITEAAGKPANAEAMPAANRPNLVALVNGKSGGKQVWLWCVAWCVAWCVFGSCGCGVWLWCLCGNLV